MIPNSIPFIINSTRAEFHTSVPKDPKPGDRYDIRTPASRPLPHHLGDCPATVVVTLDRRASLVARGRGLPPCVWPNILFVIADQWRAQAFGFAGDPNVRTPHRRPGAGEHPHGQRGFRRSGLLPGARLPAHGQAAAHPWRLSERRAARSRRGHARQGAGAGGLRHRVIGKWHLNGDGRSAFIPRERRQGFDYWKALECTHDYNHSFYYADGPEKLLWQGFDAIAQTGDARQYLRDHSQAGKPFCLFLSWGPPHDPYQTAPARYREKYQPAQFKLRPNVPESGWQKARAALAGYYASCTALDDCMGDLLQTLRETGLEKNTLLVFTSNHGNLLGSHGAYFKQQPYDESVRVPLILHWPGGFGTGASEPDALINSEDIMPTLLGLCHLPIPQTVEGLDFSGYLHCGRDPSDGAALISQIAPFGQWGRRAGGREFRGVRTRRYTYVRDLKGPWLLFDNQTDPYQMNNLADDPAQAGVRAELDATLTRKLKAASDQFLPAEAYIRQWGYHVDANGTVPYRN